MTGNAPKGWQRLRVHYENCAVDGESFEKSTSSASVAGVDQHLPLSLDAIDLLVEIKHHRPEGQTECWTWVEIDIHDSGEYAFDYRYGVPPLTAEAPKHAPA